MNRSQRVGAFRAAIGIAQMAMAVVTLGLYFRTGGDAWSYGSLAVTLLLLVGSRATFGERLSISMNPLAKRCVSEFLGTFALVFAGTGAIVINQVSGGAVTHVGVALTFGLIVMAMIYTFGDISGAHLNPAVTIGFVAAQRMRAREGLFYIGTQIVGAIAASETLRLLFPNPSTLGATLPAGSELQSFWLEFLLTAFLMLVILSVSVGAKEKGITAGIAIGGVIALEALFAGPICGASMNPARSLAPALVSGHLASLWIYLLAPVAGALVAVPLCICVREADCCTKPIPS